MNPADYGMTWQEVAEKRLEYIKHLEATITLTERGLRQSIDQAMSWLEHLQDVVDFRHLSGEKDTEGV